MIVQNKIKQTDEIIADTTMMFTACACYVLHERNGFSKQRLMQFIADIEQVNRENEYKDIVKVLKDKLDMDFPNGD